MYAMELSRKRMRIRTDDALPQNQIKEGAVSHGSFQYLIGSPEGSCVELGDSNDIKLRSGSQLVRFAA